MAGAIAEPRDEVSENAPKIVSFQIPVDRIGEVIGPKGKVINALQAETGADITVDDDGLFGIVTIGAKDGGAVKEAKRRIFLIVDPPEAEVGAVYPGKVVNITKFGAFVNILPGRDGLLHISKIGGGKRVDRVEDVLSLGQDVEVKVDDIDPQGKVSLSLVGEPPAPTGNGSSSSAGAGSSGSSRPSGPVTQLRERPERPEHRHRAGGVVRGGLRGRAGQRARRPGPGAGHGRRWGRARRARQPPGRGPRRRSWSPASSSAVSVGRQRFSELLQSGPWARWSVPLR